MSFLLNLGGGWVRNGLHSHFNIWCCCLGRLWSFGLWSLVERSQPLGAGLRVLAIPLPVPPCDSGLWLKMWSLSFLLPWPQAVIDPSPQEPEAKCIFCHNLLLVKAFYHGYKNCVWVFVCLKWGLAMKPRLSWNSDSSHPTAWLLGSQVCTTHPGMSDL